MRIPNGQRAVVPIEKIAGYALNPEHPRGKHKARVFRRALGLTTADADWLRSRLLEAARDSEDARQGQTDGFGTRYELDIALDGPSGRGVVRSIWIVASAGASPVLVTCFVL